MSNVPPDVVRQLARDAELAVSSPVLRFSAAAHRPGPARTSSPRSWLASSATLLSATIAGRDRLGARISDAVVAADDEPAVAALLANPSAQIREETLDMIVERAPARTSWHGPLVRRPKLPSGAASRIARFVAASLLDVLKNRKDLPAETQAKGRGRGFQAADHRGRGGGEDGGSRSQSEGRGRRRSRRNRRGKARRLKKDGKLDEDAVADALDAGQRGFVRAP